MPPVRDHIPVVVQGRGRRARGARRNAFARALWVGAEVITTLGVVVALLVVHQVWWTNRQALVGAHEQVRALERAWGEPATDPGPGSGPEPGAEGADGTAPPSVGSAEPPPSGSTASSGSGSSGGAARASRPPAGEQAYAVLRIPRLGLSVPVARGVDKRTVLDKGYAGQYPGTARPGEQGNFALAGHRNTHGEPFRHINRLRPGDEIQVDVRGRRSTYVVDRTLAETTERDTGVIAPVPRSLVKPGYGYTAPGAYITLTTCTPEYTSTYRLVVWGTLKSPSA